MKNFLTADYADDTDIIFLNHKERRDKTLTTNYTKKDFKHKQKPTRDELFLDADEHGLIQIKRLED